MNPYAAPATVPEAERGSEPGIGMWRDGGFLVTHLQATFPPRCIFTNEASEIRRRQKIRWSYPLDLTHRYLPLEFSVCATLQRQIVRQRGQRTMTAIACFAPSLIAFLLLVLGYVSCVGLVVIAFSLLASALAFKHAQNVGELLEFHSVKGSYFWLTGAQPAFLDSLPEWPGGSLS